MLQEACKLPEFRVGRRKSVAMALPNMNLYLDPYECGKDEMDE